MGEVPKLLEKQGVRIYNKPTTHIYVQGDDPDGACVAALSKIRGNILKERHNKFTLDIVRDLYHTVRIIKIRTISYA